MQNQNVFENAAKILYEDSIKQQKINKLRNKLIKELGNNLSPAQILYSSISELLTLRRKIEKEKTPSCTQKEVVEFFQKHCNNIGFSQAIKDLQRGLSILNKNRKNSPIEAKNILIEDGIYGTKTKAAFKNACNNYSSRIIKKYILKGIINNIIFDTKNNYNINSEDLLYKTTKDLKEEL